VLYRNGFRNMMILDEGLPGWHAKKYPTEGSLRKG
jgi:3-mercaptopyruvate sulfurtransferase SseA